MSNISLQPISFPIVPRKFCNKSGPSNWRRYAFEFIKFVGFSDDLDFDYSPARSVRSPKLFFLSGMIVTVACSILRCVVMAIRNKSSFSILNASVLGSSLTTGLLAGAAYMFVVFLIACSVADFFRMRVMDLHDYKQYLINRFQKILDANKLELAYREIFITFYYLDTHIGSFEFRLELHKKLLEKLLQVGYLEIKTLCRLIASVGYNNRDLYFAMCAKKIYEDTGDAERTYIMISLSGKERERLLHEYALKQLRDHKSNQESLQMAQTVLSGIQLGGKGPLQLITEYASHPNWEMPIIFARAIYSKEHRAQTFQDMDPFYRENQEWFDVFMLGPKLKIKEAEENCKSKVQRIFDEQDRFMLLHNALLKESTSRTYDVCDPEVLCALQRIDGGPSGGVVRSDL